MTQKAPAIKIKNNALKDTRGDKIFFAINAFILGLLALIILYPLYFIVIASFSDPDAVLGGQVVLAPVNITFEGYEKVFQRGDIWQGYLNTIIYTVVTVILSLVVTWAVILPAILSVWNLFMSKTFFESSIPEGMLEAARIDGAGKFRTFFSIVLPLSKAIIAVMALYYAVGQWNSYFNAMIFLQDESKYPLQLVLKEILIASESTVGGSGETILQQYRLANQLKYVSVIVSSLPVLCLYPFVQKYFAQGVMIGSLKG